MADKGSKPILAPQALRLYGKGFNLSAIASQLGVSVTSLKRWKDDSKDPNQAMDEWDRARSHERNKEQRLQILMEEQLAYVESLHPSKRQTTHANLIDKYASILERWDKREKAQRVADDVDKVIKKAGLTKDTADEIRRQILGIGA